MNLTVLGEGSGDNDADNNAVSPGQSGADSEFKGLWVKLWSLRSGVPPSTASWGLCDQSEAPRFPTYLVTWSQGRKDHQFRQLGHLQGPERKENAEPFVQNAGSFVPVIVLSLSHV